MLRESCPCSSNSFQSCAGKSLSVVHKPEMKWSLKVCMARSAASTLWLCGSTNCSFMFFFCRYVLIFYDATLSRMFSVGLNLLSVRYVTHAWNAVIISLSDEIFILLTKISFVV